MILALSNGIKNNISEVELVNLIQSLERKTGKQYLNPRLYNHETYKDAFPIIERSRY